MAANNFLVPLIMIMIEFLKYIVYRTPVIKRIMWPKYRYGIHPGQLAAMVQLMENTKGEPGCIIEIGVAVGKTSVFLLEHLKTTEDSRPVLFFDTFCGFTPKSVALEINDRSKSKFKNCFQCFQYGNEQLFSCSIAGAGYTNFKTYKGDAAEFDFSTIGPISAVLLDIDLYQPTLTCLRAIWPYLVEGGGIVIDDCIPGGPWDGSLQAVEEFAIEIGAHASRVGGKGMMLFKST